MPPTTGQSENRSHESPDETASEDPPAGSDASERERIALEREIATPQSDVASLEEEVARLEAALTWKNRRLQGTIDRYERIIAERNRERGTDDSAHESSLSESTLSPRTSVLEIVGSLLSGLS